MRILVTGAGGFVGGHLSANLIQAGHEVVATSLRPFDARGALATAVVNLLDLPKIKEIVAQYEPEAVIHLAAQASVVRSWADPAETYRTNVVGTSNLLESVKDRPHIRVLLVGSAQEYGGADRPLAETDPLRPSSPYAVSKAAQELLGLLYHRELGVPVVMARSFNHTGPGQSADYAVGSFCSQIAAIERQGRPPQLRVGPQDAVRDFLDVRDVADAYRLLAESGQAGEAYNVASGEGARIGDLLKMLLDRTGLAGVVEVLEEPATRAGDPHMLVGDSSKIRAAVGWRPRIPIQISLVETLDWYRKPP